MKLSEDLLEREAPHFETERNSRGSLKVLVWAVYPPNSGWRGEGISQTLENILFHAPTNVQFTLLVSAAHLLFVQDVLGDRPNVKLVPIGVQLRRLKSYLDRRSLLRGVGPVSSTSDRFGRIFDRVKSRIALLIWKISLPLAWLSVRVQIKSADMIFNPSPAYALLGFKGKPKVFGFWDPFVFEYNAFGDIRRPLLLEFLFKYLIKSSATITQSEANKAYLTDVLLVDPEKVHVIYNGSPDYSQLFEQFQRVQTEGEAFNRISAPRLWPVRKPQGRTKIEAANVLITDTLNHSVLFRLCSNLNQDSRIILVSTQYRPYKGFEVLFALFDRLLECARQFDFHFVFTAELPDKIRSRAISQYPWIVDRVYEMTRLSNLQHACLYKLCDLVLHPSFVEGGPTLYPASEAASLGIPSLTNIGRHTRELLKRDGDEFQDIVVNFMHKDETMKKILALLTEEHCARRNIELVQRTKIEWCDASREYVDVFRKIVDENRNV